MKVRILGISGNVCNREVLYCRGSGCMKFGIILGD